MNGDRETAAREALVRHAVQGLLELTPARLLSAVGVKDIAARAGVGVSTVYHHFGNLDGFAEAVLERVYRSDAVPSDVVAERLDRIRESSFPLEHGRALHHADFLRLTGDPELRLRLGLWALGGATADASYRAFLRATERPMHAHFAAMLRSWHREPQPPFEIESLTATHVAVVSGASVRHLADPGTLDADRFARVATALTMTMTRTIGDPRGLDDRLAEINYFPLRAARTRAISTPRRDAHDRLLRAAAELFSTVGYGSTTVPQVAKRAGLGTSTAYARFATIDDIALALVRQQAEDHLGDDQFSGAPLEVVDHRLESLAAFLAPRAGFLAPYGLRLLTADLPDDDPITLVLCNVLRDAQQAGAITGNVDARRIAVSLASVLVGAVLARPADGAASAAAHARQLVLAGVATSGGAKSRSTL